MDHKANPTNQTASVPGALFNLRELSLLRHYTDPTSPGYGNGTKAAELAGYEGAPGSSQLAVQASRTLTKARKHNVLIAILNEKGCTLEHAAERLAACLDAKRRRVFVTKDGNLLQCEPEDDHHHQLQAAKLVLQLQGAFERPSQQELPAPAPCREVLQATDQEKLSGEYRKALEIMGESDPVDRVSLRDVLECDAQSAESEPNGETDQDPGQCPTTPAAPAGNPSQA